MPSNSPGLGYLITKSTESGNQTIHFQARRSDGVPASNVDFRADSFETEFPLDPHIVVWQGPDIQLPITASGEVAFLQVGVANINNIVFYLEHPAISVSQGDTIEYKNIQFSNQTGDV